MRGFYLLLASSLARTNSSSHRATVLIMKLQWRKESATRAGQKLTYLYKLGTCCSINLVGGKLIVYGGSNDPIRNNMGRWTPYWTNTMYEFDLDSREWTRVYASADDIPLPCRYRHTSCLVDDLLFIFGGIERRRKTNKLFVFDIPLRVWNYVETSGIEAPAVEGHSMAYFPDNDALLLFGGVQNQAVLSNRLLKLSIDAKDWSVVETKGAPPLARSGCGSTKCKLLWYLFGGTGPYGQTLNDMHLLDYSPGGSPVWSQVRVASAVQPGLNPLMVRFEGKLVLFGRDYRNANEGTDVYLFDINQHRWFTADTPSCRIDGPKPTPRTFTGIVSTGESVLCFAMAQEESQDRSLFVLSEKGV